MIGARRLISHGLMLMVALSSATIGCGSEELHEGRPMAYWIANLTSKDTAIRRRAAEAFVHDAPRTPEAIDALLSVLNTEAEADVHATVAEALGALGPDATRAVPELVRLLDDDHVIVRQHAAAALGTVGVGAPAAAAALAHALRDADHDVRAAAAQSLGRLGRTASPQASTLVMVASDDRIGWVRLQAVVALGRIEGDPRVVVPALVSCD